MVMMRSEDQEHGFSIHGRDGLLSEPEPSKEETDRMQASDKLVLEYMKKHDHYGAAFNAITWRGRATFAGEQLVLLAAAIMGLDPAGKLPEDVVLRAQAERGRLMERVAINENSLATMTELVNRVQRFNMSMVTDVLEGRNAKDELRILAARFGVKVEPGDSAIVISHKIQADRFAGTSVMAKQTQ